MRQFFGPSIIVCSAVLSVSAIAAPQLFNVELKGATRDQMRAALENTNILPLREDNNYWVDKYDPNGALQGASELNIGYTSAGKLAYAEYKFPVFMDSGKIMDVGNLIASKYGQPSQRSGNTRLGDASFTWNFKNGMKIIVYRGWPDTTTYLQFKEPTHFNKMNAEIKAQEQREFQQKAKQQHAAF